MEVDWNELDVFHGELTPARAVIYVRLPRPTEPGIALTGSVRGPRCLHAQTLPASWPLVDLGPGPTLLAQAIVTEPCFWSSDVPAIYDVTVHLERGGEVLATERREIGLRGLGPRGRGLLYQGKNWVLRGVLASSTTAELPRQWHDASAAYVTGDVNEERLAEAGQWGALAVVRLDASTDDLVPKLRQLAKYPGVAIAALRGQLAADPSSAAPNLLLAHEMQTEKAVSVPPWADIVIVQADKMEHSGVIDCARPVIALRPLETRTELDAARAACDRLQRDLAPLGQFAGYIV
jgi:hypothetical protein